MKLQWRQALVYFVPLACNLALIVYLAWQLGYASPMERHSRLQMFALLYAVGGVVVAVSGVAAFLHATARDKGPRAYYALALINIIVPTALLLFMLKFA
ncbi:MAG TPA: hypothetical protein VNM24_09965 [Burkholderiales bacterium]|nr:hypothetical protein [Burkholderiales bacterium]